MKLTTLCYIEKDNKYLMLHRNKKENDLSHNMWIGVGGHFEDEETPDECLLREVKEETNLTLTNYKLRGIITFLSNEAEGEYMFLYTANEFNGELKECDEGELEWIDKKDLFKLNFWTGDEIFLKLIRDDYPLFSLKLRYDGKTLVSANLDGNELELFDILDDSGNKTGLVRERSVVHELGYMHKTVHIWVIRKKKDGFDVLLQKRSANKDSFPGYYDISSAGHIHAGDRSIDSAIRELEEELGITAAKEELHFIGIHKGIEDTEFYGKPFRNHEFSKMYVYMEDIDTDKLTLQKEEVESVMWIDYEEGTKLIKEQKIKNCIFMDEWIKLKDIFTMI